MPSTQTTDHKAKTANPRFAGGSREAAQNAFFSPENAGSFFSAIPIQTKLTVGAPDDPLEKEADQVADTIMRMPEKNDKLFFGGDTVGSIGIQRKCKQCEEEDKIHRKPIADSVAPPVQTKDSHNLEVNRSPIVGINKTFFQPKPFTAIPVQRKCAACEEENKKEIEEDKSAAEPIVQRKCAACDDEDNEIRRQEDDANMNAAEVE